MNGTQDEYLNELIRLREETLGDKEVFHAAHGDEVEVYRQLISEGVQTAINRLSQKAGEISGHNKTAEQLVNQTTEYFDWLQWTFWDLPYIAVALKSPKDQFPSRVAACGMIYLSARIFDDVLDRHFWYKGKHPTLLSIVSESHDNSQGAEGLTVLAGLLLCFEGFSYLHHLENHDGGNGSKLQDIIHSIQSTVIGAIMEQSPSDQWTPEYYHRLIRLKNVEYWHILYMAIDPGKGSALYPFLQRYYTLAQMLNDVHDYPEDERHQQPNLLWFYLPRDREGRSCLPINSAPVPTAPPEVENILAAEFLEIEQVANGLPPLDRLVARTKINDSLEQAFQLGLFMPRTEKTAESRHRDTKAVPLKLQWYSEIHEIIERAGPNVLEHMDCPVCSSNQRKFLFQKQGFSFHRCPECSHIYPSPCINLELQIQMALELDPLDKEDDLLKIQKIYAPFICELIRSRASGHRLLDIGFGGGYLMELCRAYGFEVYGIDGSAAHVERLQPQFGERVRQVIAGSDEIPWNSFDVVIMSHILEHLKTPGAVLKEVLEKMNPGGLIYIAVPDMDAVQFRIYGKNLDSINPLVHFQYFNQASLSRLLIDCGFHDSERVRKPLIPEEIAPRYMSLMRDLGGNDSGELDMIAKCS